MGDKCIEHRNCPVALSLPLHGAISYYPLYLSSAAIAFCAIIKQYEPVRFSITRNTNDSFYRPLFGIHVRQDSNLLKKASYQTEPSKNHPRRLQPELWQSSNHLGQHRQNQ